MLLVIAVVGAVVLARKVKRAELDRRPAGRRPTRPTAPAAEAADERRRRRAAEVDA